MSMPSAALILGSIAGLLLALAQFLFSSLLSRTAVSTSLVRSEMVMLFGFLFKLTVLGLVFFGLSRVPAVDFVAALVSFLAGVTILLLWRTISTLRTMAKLRRESHEDVV